MRKDHVAIMRKSWGLTRKILSGEKTIESRWYINRHKPWGVIQQGDVVYFKDSGEPIRLMAKVSKVIQFENLTPKRVRDILGQYAQSDGLGINERDIKPYFEMFKNKKYCILIFLKNPQAVKPFEIDKSGFGTMASWITVDNIDLIKKKP